MGLVTKIKNKIHKKKVKRNKKNVISQAIQKLCSDLVVLNGPFKGMVYPDAASVGSTFFPKVLGSYESELHPVINTILNKYYTDIVDIGCAEGYYAIGLGRHFPEANVYAYDINEFALKQCKKMMDANKLDKKRFVFGDECTQEKLKLLPLSEKALIVSDCEGYELELFSESTVESLKQHDFLIETHDCINIEISTKLYSILNKTHDIKIIKSSDDILKAKYYDYPELLTYSLKEKLYLLSEERGAIMEWFYATPRV